MARYEYTALDPTGKEVRGALDADGRAAALDRIALQGLSALAVQERRDGSPAAAAPVAGRKPGRVSRANVDAFTRQLANLLSAGVSLSRALSILSREASQPSARALWSAIHDDVVGGTSLADALAKWPRTFPNVYVAMVRAGETGGFLDLVLEQIADFNTREQELKGKARAALVYPAVLATLAVGVLVFLLIYFIPRFSAIFADFGGALPWLTQAIVAVSNFVARYGAFLLVAVVVAVVAVRRALDSDAGRRAIERMLLGIPAMGRVVAHFALVRFCRMLGTLLGAGVPLVAALRVAREAIGTQTLADTVSDAVEEVQSGSPLAASLARSGALFPADVVEMVAVAEESGRLDKELIRVAAAYEGELDRRLHALVTMAEPILLFVMAAVVGIVVIGMLLPVFTLQELIR